MFQTIFITRSRANLTLIVMIVKTYESNYPISKQITSICGKCCVSSPNHKIWKKFWRLKQQYCWNNQE